MKDLYIIASEREGEVYYKVGRARDVGSRVASLQTGSPVELKLCLVVSRGGRLEKAIHSLWSPFRVRGEWFSRSQVELVLERFNDPSVAVDSVVFANWVAHIEFDYLHMWPTDHVRFGDASRFKRWLKAHGRGVNAPIGDLVWDTERDPQWRRARTYVELRELLLNTAAWEIFALAWSRWMHEESSPHLTCEWVYCDSCGSRGITGVDQAGDSAVGSADNLRTIDPTTEQKT